jgi:predicted small metal-binding protein
LLIAESNLDATLTEGGDAAGTMTRGAERIGLAIHCECGTSVEARDEDDLLDELLDHIAAAHEDGIRVDPADMLIGARAD